MNAKVQWVYLRGLASKYMEMAQGKEMLARRKRWDDLFMLRKPDRPPIVVFSPPGVTMPETRCSDALCLRMEKFLLGNMSRTNEFADDFVCYPYFPINHQFTSDDIDWGVGFEKGFSDGNTSRNLYAHSPIKVERDLDKIEVANVMETVANITQDETLQKEVLILEEQLGDIIPIRQTVSYFPWMGNIAAKLMGMEELMVNMVDKPDFVHSMMKIIQHGELRILETMEERGVFGGESNCHLNYPNLFTESLKSSPSSVPCKLNEMWGFIESQEFQLVSPEMTNQFLFEYQKPVMRRFKYVAYGCCEDLSRKLDYVLELPNVRAVVNSPWTDLRITAEKCGDSFAILWRQPFSEIMFAKSDNDIHMDLERGMKITQGCRRAIYCREVNWSMLQDPKQRALKWVEAARDVAEKYA